MEAYLILLVIMKYCAINHIKRQLINRQKKINEVS